MREQIEVLEHQSEVLLTLLDLHRLLIHGTVIGSHSGSRFAHVIKLTLIHGLKKSCNPKQRGLSGTGGSDYRNYLSLSNRYRNSL